MAPDGLLMLCALVEVLRPAFTAPSFANFVVLFSGWTRTAGTHAVTAALVASGVSGKLHHAAFHRFFSRARWSADEVGRLLCLRLLPLAGSVLRVAVDDSLATKKGPRIFGLGCHLDPVCSTRRAKHFTFGHVWVVLAVLVRVPFSSRVWALPVLFRLFRNPKEGLLHRKKTELARELIECFASWVGDRRVEVMADGAYCNETVMKGLPKRIVVIGAMRPDAVLTRAPRRKRRSKKSGRPLTRGVVLPKPEQLYRSEKHPWQTCVAELYGRTVTVRFKSLVGQWYRASGTMLLRVVVVKLESGALPFRVFFSMDPSMSARQILEAYSWRWAIEVCFRDLKQLLGWGDSSARKPLAVKRTAPWVGLSYTLLVLWFAEGAHRLGWAWMPVRPWYQAKTELCFADILRAAQRVLEPLEVLDPARSLAELARPPRKAARPAPCALSRAA